MDKHLLIETLKKLNSNSAEINKSHVFVGLDGFIDSIQRPVKSQNSDGPEFFATIKDFAINIGKAAGKSAQFEIVTQETKLGGNAPIMAHAMGSLGFQTTCLGNFGDGSIDGVFKEVHENVNLITLGNAAISNALEFNDGKILMSVMDPLIGINWDYVKNKVGLETIKENISSSSLTALVDWCNLPQSTDVWKGILEEVLPNIKKEKRNFFFDIADPSRRTDEELNDALEVIKGYNQYGLVTLGLNENETEKLYSCLHRVNQTEEESISLVEKGNYIYGKIKVGNLLIHPTNRTISINKNGVSKADGRFVKKPKISTGGGDNFNAGYCLGQLLGFTIEESMVAGMANSGAYVQNGQSCSLNDLILYLENWINEIQ